MATTYRATAATEASPRIAVLGTAMTAQEVGVKVSTDNPAPDKYASVVARYVDANNFLKATIHLDGSTDTVFLVTKVGGFDTPIFRAESSPIVQANAWYGIRLVVFPSGRVIATFFGPGGEIHQVIEDRSPVLATGGALASGKGGFADQSTGPTPATRLFDSFYIATPAPEPLVINSGRTLEVRHDSALRDDATGTYWGDAPGYRGSRAYIPVAGTRGRKTRIAALARRNDIIAGPDSDIADSTKLEVRYTPRYLYVPR